MERGEDMSNEIVEMGGDVEIPKNERDGYSDDRENEAQKIKVTDRAYGRIMGRLIIWGLISLSAMGAMRQEAQAVEHKDKQKTEQMQPEEQQSVRQVTFKREERKLPPEFFTSDQKDYLTLQYGEDIFKEIQDRILFQKINEEYYKEGAESKKLVVENFEEAEISSDFVKQLCETYPRGWVDTEVDSVMYVDTLREVHESYGDALNQADAAATATLKKGGATKVDFYKGPTMDNLWDINSVLAHELGHANGWWSDNSLSPEMKRQIFMDVTQRYFEGENVYFSPYVEAIENEDPNVESRIKVTEYWAEICEEYFCFPERMQENSPEDYKIVDKYVQLQDPGYDVVESAQKRMTMIDEARQEKALGHYSADVREQLSSLSAQLQELQNKLYAVYDSDVSIEEKDSAYLRFNEQSDALETQQYELAVGPEAQEELKQLLARFSKDVQAAAEAHNEATFDNLYSQIAITIDQFNQKYGLEFDGVHLVDRGASYMHRILNPSREQFYKNQRSIDVEAFEIIE